MVRIAALVLVAGLAICLLFGWNYAAWGFALLALALLLWRLNNN